MISQDEKITLFLNAISENLEMRRQEIAAEIAAVRKAEQDKAEKEANERSDAYIKTESEKIRLQTNRAQSVLETELRNELAAARNNITDAVFAGVAEKLGEFAQTAAYAEFIKKSAARISSFFGNTRITVFVKTADLNYTDHIVNETGSGSTVAADDGILIGGFKSKKRSEQRGG
jgi:vacuolar-type H+-ATPase subunit E/Vma4